MSDVGKMLAKIRLAADYSQERLAQALGMDRAYISRIETGARKPSWRYIVSFSELIGISPTELLKEAGYLRKAQQINEVEQMMDLMAADADAAFVLEFMKDHPRERKNVARFIRAYLEGQLDEDKESSRGHEPGRSPTPEDAG